MSYLELTLYSLTKHAVRKQPKNMGDSKSMAWSPCALWVGQGPTENEYVLWVPSFQGPIWSSLIPWAHFHFSGLKSGPIVITLCPGGVRKVVMRTDWGAFSSQSLNSQLKAVGSAFPVHSLLFLDWSGASGTVPVFLGLWGGRLHKIIG